MGPSLEKTSLHDEYCKNSDTQKIAVIVLKFTLWKAIHVQQNDTYATVIPQICVHV